MSVRELFEVRDAKLAAVAAALLFVVGLVFMAQPAKASHNTTCEIIDGTRVCTPDIHTPPTVSLDHGSRSVLEGQTATNSGTFSDPDGNATVTLSASVGSVTKDDANGTWSWSFTTADGPAQSQTVTITASDGTDNVTTSFTLTVNNRAPVVMQMNYPTSLDEGGTATISLLDPSDVPADKNAGFRYAFACDGSLGGSTYNESIYANSGTSNSTTCTYDDSGTKTLFARIIDKDDGYSHYGRSITVNNVAPTATFNAPASVDYGAGITISLTNASDPSSADEASLTYAFDCGDGAGYGAAGSAASKTCATIDQQTMRVKGKVTDKDGGTNEYTKTLSVNNVKPTVSLTSPVEGAYVRGVVPLRATASDNVGVSRVEFYAERGYWQDADFQSWEEVDTTAPYEASWDTTKFQDGPALVQAGAFDGASEAYDYYEVIVDNTKPTGTVKINGAAAYTRNAAVKLSLSASDLNGVTSMRFSNNGTNWSAWEPYAASKSWTLGGGNGTRTVHAQYRDKAGNVSTAAWDAIKLDTAKPTVSGMSPRHGSIIKDRTPTIKATVRDNMTNIQKSNIRLYVAGKAIPASKFRYSRATDKLVYNSPKLSKGKKTVKIVAVDAARNVGAKSWYFKIR